MNPFRPETIKSFRSAEAPNYLAPVLFLAVCILWLRLEDITLFAVDSIVYSEIAKLLSKRPIWEWSQLTWLGGAPYYDHPPLMKWALALSIRLLGSNSLAAVLPAVLFSTGTVALVYMIARELWDDRYALYAGIILCLTPPFIRDGRNPMLEPALMFFIYLSLYLGIIAAKGQRVGFAWISGVAIALGWLSKGPPVFIVFPALLWIAHLYDLEKRLIARLWIRTLLGFVIPFVLFETWHHSQTSRWFLWEYYRAQVVPATILPTAQTLDYFFYFKDCLARQWPWLAPALIAPFFVFRSPAQASANASDRSARKLFIFSLILWLGPLIAFSLFQKKSSWYANMTTPALALMAAIPFQLKAVTRNTKKLLSRSCIFLGVMILFLGSTLPSLFKYQRPVEDFFHQANRSSQVKLMKDEPVADCVGLDPWKGPSLIAYYLNASSAACDADTPFRFEPSGKVQSGSIVLFQSESFALVQKR